MQAIKTLGRRLDAIFDLVESRQQHKTYDAIWDCGCDHGYLGQKILAAELCETLYFIDQVPHIIKQLASRLRGYPGDHYRTIATDAGLIEFPPNKRHLVILAGIGGERIIEILRNIARNTVNEQIDYLLCPSTGHYELREYLSTTAFCLHHESIVSEKGRDYEIILINAIPTTDSKNRVSLTGKMWDKGNANHHRHHRRLMTHYQKQSLGNKAQRAEMILQHYENCLDNSG